MSYLGDLGYEADVLLNVATGGTRDETVSLRTAKAASRWNFQGLHASCLLCRWLSLTVERDHCQKTLAGQTTRPTAGLRAAIEFTIVLVAIWAALHFGLWGLIRHLL